MILLLDNYDSFTWNLYHYLEQLADETVVVLRNDQLDIGSVADYSSVVLSPGPGLPSSAGIMMELIKRYATEKPMLGVCLGHQAIGEAFGARLLNLEHVLHGVQKEVFITDPSDKLFIGLPPQIQTGHYHSWVVDRNGFSDDLNITAVDDQANIMAFAHKKHLVYGVQFHPESVMTPEGKKIIANWLHHCRKR